ncbi:cbb3-type cytochrome c oxidase subunit I [Gracilibacillus sp. JCM 18860]|uniref:cbb3-type cytochrome c oxidase subunit I n=1 Tax=Gracilibacillus sp. JCM 18860 TaxID=1306159 RepID=UPI003260B3C1
MLSQLFEKIIFGYSSMVLSIILIGFLGFMVWVHHMFTVGLGPMVNTFFAITTMLIAVPPTGIKVFNWLFTMRGWPDSVNSTHVVCHRIYPPLFYNGRG